jgi:hypothetical protein
MTSDQHMNPPPGIERDILEYLHLEFGEDKDDPDALQAADLKYVGVREDGGALLHFWEYPSGSGKSWATAESRRTDTISPPAWKGPAVKVTTHWPPSVRLSWHSERERKARSESSPSA